MQHHKRIYLTGLAAAGIAVAALAVTACGSSSRPLPAASAATPSVTATPSVIPSAAASSGYPQQAADEALCNQYNSDSGDLQAMAQQVQQAGSSVTPALANAIMNVVNNPGSLSQDEHNMLYVTMDCALAQAGRPPVELNK